MIVDSWPLRRRWRRLQRPVAVLLIGSGGLLMYARQNTPPKSVATVVAVTDVAPGDLLEASDVQVVQWPQDARPPAADSVEAVVGRRTTSLIRRGEPVAEHRVVGPSLLAAVGPGRVAVALSAAPLAAAGLVQPGDVVDVVGRTDGGPRTLAAAANVLAVADGNTPIVAVPGSSAAAVVQAAATESVSVVLRPG